MEVQKTMSVLDKINLICTSFTIDKTYEIDFKSHTC